MTTVEDASSIILRHLYQPSTERVSISAAVGRVLGETVTADRDLPPFHRVTMDGIAVSSSAFQSGQRDFKILATLAAGQPVISLNDPHGCIEIMTGAVLPTGADAVIRYEDIVITNGFAHCVLDVLAPGNFIHKQSSDAVKGEVLLTPGIIISPAEVALFASTGKSTVSVFAFPRIAVISTGDELVEIDDIPLPYQLRRSNSAALESALAQMGCRSRLFHIVDQQEILEQKIREILAGHDVVILSGGVSKGKFDYVPEVLTKLGIKKLFHQVSQRPGKPFWFGVTDGKTVFALPGNPVSVFMCFFRYIKPWLMKSLLGDEPFPEAVLAEDYTFTPDLTYFLQVRTKFQKGRLLAWPAAGGGSGDFVNLKGVDGFLELPKGTSLFKSGEVFSFIPFRYF